MGSAPEARNVSEECTQDSAYMISAAQRGVTWALHMIDSATKIPDGILYGNIDQLGNYDQCLKIHVNDSTATFQGFYCRVVLFITTDVALPTHVIKLTSSRTSQLTTRANNELVLRVAVCLPSTCSPADVKQLIDQYAPEVLSLLLNMPLNVSAFVDPNYCSQFNDAEPITLASWMYVALLVLLMAVVVSATVVDCWGGSSIPEDATSLLRTFSGRATACNLFSTRSESGQLGCLHGLRVLSMAWIILGHRYEAYLLSPISNSIGVLNTMVRNPGSMAVLNGFLAVDTFFFLSGFLICHVFLREMQRSQKFDVLKFYAYRFLRLTVPMAVVIAFYVTVMSNMSDGPGWEGFIGVRFRNTCEKYWWSALLYVNNYIGVFEQCLEQTWYTSVDMQLSWLSPLVLLPLHHSPRAGLQLLTLLVVVSCLLPFTITFLNDYPWSADLVNTFYDTAGFTQDVYLPTHTRATPYLIGILLAYYIFRTRGQPLKLSKNVMLFCWTATTATCLAVVYTFAIPYQEGFQHEPVSASFYAGFHRLGWSLGLSWIVLACVKGHGGPVETVLAWSGFRPLSHLTYAAYLTHLIVIGGITGSLRTTSYLSHFEAVHAFFGDLPLVLITSLFLYFCVEAPLMVFLRHAFARGGVQKTNQSTNNVLKTEGAEDAEKTN